MKLSIWEKIWCAASVPLEDLQVELMAHVKRWQRCPNCRFYIQQIGKIRVYVEFGESRYNYITCRCGTKFCYDCGDIPRQGGRCKCNRFECLQVFFAVWDEIRGVFEGLFCEGCFRICEE